MSYESIVLRVIALRKSKGWSQQELADRSGVGVSTIRNIEGGRHTSTDTLDKLNNALDEALY